MQKPQMGNMDQEIEDEVFAAFPAKRTAPFDPLVNSEQGDEPVLTAVAFADKEDWTVLDWKWLDEAADGWASALSFLSHEAVCFYIPAYLVADLHGALERVDPTFCLTLGFDDLGRGSRIWPRRPITWTEYSTQRWSHLTRAQARAVVHYLEWRASGDDFGNEQQIAEALASFWYERAAGK